MNFKENSILINASQMVEYWFCPRFIYFIEILKLDQYEQLRLKVLEGREVHKKKALEPSYLRKKLGVTDLKKSVYLSDYETGICGIVDEILFLKDNLATLIDYKFAFNKRRFKTQFMQSVFYAILIEKNFKVIVPFSCIVYTRDKNELVTYEIKEKDKKKF